MKQKVNKAVVSRLKNCFFFHFNLATVSQRSVATIQCNYFLVADFVRKPGT